MNFLTGADEKEILRYLGHKGGEVEQKYLEQIRENTKQLLENAKPKCTYSVFEIESHSPVTLRGTNTVLEGKDIEKHLETSSRCILLAATLGFEVDKIIRVKSVCDMADAVIFDSCASSGIENLCDNFTGHLKKEFEAQGLYLTERYSPGYGDFPLKAQKDICALTDSLRKIGLSCNEAFLSEPVKSVTAVIGISDRPCNKRLSGCESCNLRGDCTMRKKGTFCYDK